MIGELLHAHSSLVTREQLVTIAPPPATETWKPIGHYDLIQAIDRQLKVRDIEIRREQFALQREGARLFGVLDLGLAESPEMCAAMGIRTANDRSMALEIAVGVRVFVCDNMAFSGDLIALRRKHTAKFDLMADISRAIDRYQTHLTVLSSQLDRLKDERLTPEQAKVLMFEAVAGEIIPLRLFPVVTRRYATCGEPLTAWTLHNVFTSAVKQLAPGPAFATTVKLGRLFGLTSPNQP